MIVPGAPTPPEVASGYRAAGWWDDSGLREGLEAIAERDGDRLAVVDNEGSWSYGQLRETVERAVYALLAAGVEPGDAVLLITPNSFMGVAATLAVLRSSAVAVTLDRRCGPSDVADAVAMTDPRLLVLPGDLVTPLKVARHGRPVASFEALRAATRLDGHLGGARQVGSSYRPVHLRNDLQAKGRDPLSAFASLRCAQPGDDVRLHL